MTIDELRNEKKIPAIIAEGEGFITYVNERFKEAFGWSLKDLAGKTLTTIIPQNLHDAHNLGFSRFLTTGAPTLLNKPLKLKVVTKDGQEIDAEHIIIAEQRQDKWVFGATIRPL